MKQLAETKWHELPEPEVVRLLESDPARGLTRAEVEARLRQFGRNEVTAQKRMSEWKRFLLQFAQPLMYILVLASVVTFFLGEYVDSAVIFAVTFVNALVGFFQESKAEKAIEALSKMVLTEATVRRDGRKQRINSTGLVPGDIVLLQSGDKVPADLRLLHVRSLQVDESALTGESVPVEKHASALASGAGLGDRKTSASPARSSPTDRPRGSSRSLVITRRRAGSRGSFTRRRTSPHRSRAKSRSSASSCSG